jgi:hypothetical protein
MADLNRRELLARVGGTVAAGMLFTWAPEETVAAAAKVGEARAQAGSGAKPAPKFFTAREYATIVALSDLIIPKDDRSGSASDAGVPEFIDYIVSAQADRQVAMRGGLGWLDNECRERFDKAYLDCADAQRRQVIDDIAWPGRAKPEFSHGVRFFTTMRDLVAAGFFSSKIGVKDIGFMGNLATVWDGPPPEVLKKLGV